MQSTIENATPNMTIEETGTSEQLCKLYSALAKAQGDFEPIEKNRRVDVKAKETGKLLYSFFYADLEEITKKTRPALAKHNLATMQVITARAGSTLLTTKLVHADGGCVESIIPLPPLTYGSDSIKNFGATISYLRRYAKTALIDVAADDDIDEQQPQADQPTSQEQQQEVSDTYPESDFTALLPTWAKLIESGEKSHAQILTQIKKKASPTAEQIKRIKQIKAPQEQQADQGVDQQ